MKTYKNLISELSSKGISFDKDEISQLTKIARRGGRDFSLDTPSMFNISSEKYEEDGTYYDITKEEYKKDTTKVWYTITATAVNEDGEHSYQKYAGHDFKKVISSLKKEM